jgi:glucosamine--fructose-6-phosphate aminotransferase (isomerizing)
VATTKAFSTQLSIIYLIALYIADLLGTIEPQEYRTIVDEMMRLDQKISLCLTPDNIAKIRYYAEQHFKVHDAFFIGRNVDSAICLEGSLKLKEIAYIHSEAYPAGELKHGPISLIEDGTLVVAVATVDSLFDKTMSNVKEVRARGADVLAITTEKHAEDIKKTVQSVITVPVTHPMLQPSLSIIPLQTYAYYVALLRDCDVDKPRNLAKSVTVE